MYRKNRKRVGYLVAILALLVGTTGASSQQKQTTTEKTCKPQLQKASHLIGMDVYGEADQKLGDVEEIVLSSNGKSIQYVALSYGGFLGVGDKLFAVPWSELQKHPQKEGCVVNVRKAYLKNAPGFDTDQWPAEATKDWSKKITTFYRTGRQKALGREEASQKDQSQHAKMKASTSEKVRSAPVKLRRITQLTGMEARNYQGMDLGDLDDVVIDTTHGQAVYGVLMLPTEPWEMQREMAVVPWTAVEVLPRLHAVRIDVNKETLKTLAFNREKFPNLGNQTYATQVYRRFDVEPYWENAQSDQSAKNSKTGNKENWKERAIWSQEKPAWKTGSTYNRMFDPELARTIHGTVASVGSFKAGDANVAGLRLLVETDDDQSIVAHVGPRPYIERQDVTFHYGDRVTLTAAPVESGWRTIYIVSKIQKGDETIKLRDKDGQPKWDANKLTQQANASVANSR